MLKLTTRHDSPYWWITGTVNGRRVRESTGTTDRQKAEEYRATHEAGLWRQAKLGDKPRKLWDEAVVRHVREKEAEGRPTRDDLDAVRAVHAKLSGLYLDQIDGPMINELRIMRPDISNGRINRIMAVVRRIMNKAVREWEWLDRAPTVRRLNEPSKRIRWLTHVEALRLMEELPPHLADMAEFSLATGLRQSNVTGLEWSQIDMQRHVAWIHADQAKAKKPIPVPLNQTALAVLRRQIGRHRAHVFTYRGEPVTQTNTKAWRKALVRAGVHNFRWHDLRHTWASWHVQNGTTLAELQQLGGWSSYSMVLRYAHLAPEHLAPAASRIDTILTRQEKQGMAKIA